MKQASFQPASATYNPTAIDAIFGRNAMCKTDALDICIDDLADAISESRSSAKIASRRKQIRKRVPWLGI